MRGRLRSRRRYADRGASRAARFRQHVGGKCALRIGTCACQVAADQRAVAPGAADRAWPGFYRGLRAAGKPVSVLYVVLALVLLQRAGELGLAALNTRPLSRLGAIEIDRAGYPFFVALHTGW